MEFVLSNSLLKKWWNKLPDDIRGSFGIDVSATDEEMIDLCQNLNETHHSQFPILLDNYYDLIKNMGHCGRIYLIAWISKIAGSEATISISRILNDETDESGEGKSRVGVLFLEDLELMAEAMKNRFGEKYADGNIMSSILRTAREFDSMSTGY